MIITVSHICNNINTFSKFQLILSCWIDCLLVIWILINIRSLYIKNINVIQQNGKTNKQNWFDASQRIHYTNIYKHTWYNWSTQFLLARNCSVIGIQRGYIWVIQCFFNLFSFLFNINADQQQWLLRVSLNSGANDNNKLNFLSSSMQKPTKYNFHCWLFMKKLLTSWIPSQINSIRLARFY